MSQYLDIIMAFVAGAVFASVFLPVILRVATRRNLYDGTDFRKIHHGDVPRLGGVSFMPSLVMALLTVAGINLMCGQDAVSETFAANARPITFSALALTAIFGVGLADDIFGVRYRMKFGIQIACGVLLLCGGVGIYSLYGVAGIGHMPDWVAWPFTIIMTVFIINAMNLIDGIDGLAAILFQLAMITYGCIFLMAGDMAGLLVTAAALGVTAPFLNYNLLGKSDEGNKMFMGDTGSMTLGLITAALGMRVLNTPSLPFEINPAIAALSPIIIPCFDVVRVYCIRLMDRRSPFLPDRNHIHHRLLDLGIGQNRVLSILVAAAIIITVGNILLSTIINVNLLILADIIVWIALTSKLKAMVTRRKTVNS